MSYSFRQSEDVEGRDVLLLSARYKMTFAYLSLSYLLASQRVLRAWRSWKRLD